MLFKFARTGDKDQLKLLIKELEDGDDINPTVRKLGKKM